MLRMIGFALAVLTVSGCATASKTYGPDGREAYSLNCSGTARSWGDCLEKAGEICATRGYDIVSATNDRGAIVGANRSTLFATTTNTRSMVVSCNSA